MTIDSIETIGLNQEQRSDFELRSIFVKAYELVAPFMDETGNWRSLADECMAYDALAAHFSDIAELRRFAVMGSIASVRSSGRTPSD